VIVIDKGEAGGATATKLGLEAHDGDGVFLCLHLSSELLLDLLLGHVGHSGVDQLDGLRNVMENTLTSCFLARRGFLRNLRT